MTYHVELTARAVRNLRRIYQTIHAGDSKQAHAWFNGLEDAIFSLQQNPARSPATPEHSHLRHLLYGSSRYVYRVIYEIDERNRVVTVLHIRHGSRQALTA
jgi:plasmid stabilization system protein ParE